MLQRRWSGQLFALCVALALVAPGKASIKAQAEACEPVDSLPPLTVSPRLAPALRHEVKRKSGTG